MIALLALALAAAPSSETLGSVDGPFLVADTRVAIDNTAYLNYLSYFPISSAFAAGFSAIAQSQIIGGWGVGAPKQRFTFTASAAATGLLTSPEVRDDFGRDLPRFYVSPVLLSAAVPIPIERVVIVPVLGVTVPTRASFGVDPIVSLQPQLRFRASFGSFIIGLNGLLNLPLVTKWTPFEQEARVKIRCPTDEPRCRWPVTREEWLAAVALQGEYWFTEAFSAGLRTKLELREENLAQLVNGSSAPEGVITTLHWSVIDLQGNAFGSWAFSRFVGVSASFGLSWTRLGLQKPGLDRSGWNASLSIWFRTDERLSRFWLDR